MEITTILLLIGSFVLGVIVTFCFKNGKQNKQSEEAKTAVSKIEAEKQELAQQLSAATEEATKKTLDIKNKYEKLLAEAKTQCNELDSELKSAINGNIDDIIKNKLAEADKLKKKVKDLEEELEESKDALSGFRKKFNDKNSEVGDLQYSLSKEQNESKRLNEDLNSVKHQLDDKISELNVKVGSLDFIQEILSANEFGTEDTKTLNKNIDIFESFVKGPFIELCSFLCKSNKITWGDGTVGFDRQRDYFINSFDQWASTKRKSWLDGKTTIAFVGEFSAGKTTIVNRILSQDDPNVPLLPVSHKATTAIPTYIAGGPIVSYSFISGDGKRKTILEDSFKKVSKDILGQVKGVSALIKYFVMTYKNPNLSGLSILDTPGFNSNDKEDSERTIDAINECDALFWVFDVNAGNINESSRKSIETIKSKLDKPLYVIINQVDTKSESDIKKVEDLINKTLSNEGIKVQKIIRFSKKAPLKDIMNPIKEVKKIAVRDTFVSEVGSNLEQIQKILDDEVKARNANFNAARKQGDNIKNKFYSCMNNLKNDCETACSIPRWVEHFFSKDRFEMTPDEGNRLRSLLAQIADERIAALRNNFSEQSDNARNIEKEWSDLNDYKAAWQKINDCFEQYKKITQNIA